MAGKVSSDPNIFLLPDIGEGLQEAELKEWLVKEGDTVEENQNIAEVETDKALAEIPSPRNGVIAKLHGGEGDMMKVGAPFVSFIGDDGAAPVAEPKPEAPSQPKAEAPAEREDAGTVVGAVPEAMQVAAPGKALASPAVRRLARDLGVDINAIPGSGIGGRVIAKDVKALAGGGAAIGGPSLPATPASSASAPAAPSRSENTQAPPPPRPSVTPIPEGQATVRVPFRGIRRKIAERLRESMDKAVHFTVMDEADATAVNTLRKRLAAASGEKVSVLPFVASALANVLTRDEFRSLNVTVDDERDEIVQHRALHLGLAVDTDSGLMVPVIRDCDALGVLEVGREVSRLARAARDRSIPREELSGSTFTLSNVGSHAGRFATPVINYPEAGILAVGRGREGVVAKDGWFRTSQLLPLSLACDHRVVDGATAALALAEVIKLIENPDALLEPARR